MPSKEFITDAVLILIMALLSVGTIVILNSCSFVSLNVHQSARQVENQDGETTLSRGHDVSTEEERNALDLDIKGLK